jgi:hypothetical protein
MECLSVMPCSVALQGLPCQTSYASDRTPGSADQQQLGECRPKQRGARKMK